MLTNMLKAFHFATLWLPCIAFHQEINTNNVNLASSANLGSEIKIECSSFLRLFANATQRFNWCAVRHAKPLRFCEKCTKEYSDLLERNPVKFNDSRCVDDLVRSEKFQIVTRVYDFQTGLWDAAHCEMCYESHWVQTEHTKEFFHRLKVVQECFMNYTTLPLNVTFNESKLCDGCRHFFNRLRHIYRKILESTEDEDENRLCADIMSAMNHTRKDWKYYHCWNDNDANFSVLSLTGVLGFSTFIYYVAVRKHEKYKHNVQSRSRPVKKEVNYDSE